MAAVTVGVDYDSTRTELIGHHRIQNQADARQAVGSDVDRFFRHYGVQKYTDVCALVS
jgi:hypothetical protein